MKSNLSLKGNNILITGVSRPKGIGPAIVKKCAEAGANVIMHGNAHYDANMEYPDATKEYIYVLEEELKARNFNAKALAPSDLSIPKESEKLIDQAQKIFGKLNGLVLNHAYSVHAPIFDWTEEEINKHFMVNVTAAMMMIQAFAKQIDKEKGGVITLFTSGQYLGPMVDEIAYALSKEAIRALTVQAATALSSHQIRVNCINPGPTDTGYLTGEAHQAVANMFPSGSWGTPDDAARLVHFLHSDYAKWITGQTIASEGGFRR